ncbi:plastocyanin [Hydrogenophaga taeniospiralis]|uniref:cupredoxin domain-containing protein n=1 Tax=Hydrogenophaga taeniospiralis TaxID=65656 RepID=UPI001CFB5E8A|nr:plastocyanin [Hydrogenophaga taeniospiralis]
MKARALSGAAAATLALIAGTVQAATVQITLLARDGQPLADAVVLVEPVNGAKPPAPAPVQATINQQKMRFDPVLTLVPVGSRVRFTNLDGWEHHVRGLPAGLAGLTAGPGAGFELRLSGKVDGQPPESTEVTLGKAGPVQLGCHIHGSMRGFLFVTDSPWAVKTDAAGVATMQGVPEGAARLRVWHTDQLVEAAPTALNVTPLTALSVSTQVQPRRRRP